MDNVQIKWREVAPGYWQTRAVDPRTRKVYLSHPVPTAFAVKLGMKREASMEVDIIQAVVDALEARGYTVYNEHPGAVQVDNGDGTGLWTSDQNETWTLDLIAEDGTHRRTWDTGLLRTCIDPQRIADAVEAVIREEGRC
jgi:hypothetical protein